MFRWLVIASIKNSLSEIYEMKFMYLNSASGWGLSIFSIGAGWTCSNGHYLFIYFWSSRSTWCFPPYLWDNVMMMIRTMTWVFCQYWPQMDFMLKIWLGAHLKEILLILYAGNAGLLSYSLYWYLYPYCVDWYLYPYCVDVQIIVKAKTEWYVAVEDCQWMWDLSFMTLAGVWGMLFNSLL